MPRSVRATGFVALAVFATTISVEACSSTTDASAIPESPAFSLIVDAASLSLTPGDSANVRITVIRAGGLTSAIAFSVAGTPAGLIAAIAAPSSADSTALTVSASKTLAAGTYSIVVNAAASGAAEQHATIEVNVVPDSGSVAIRFLALGAHSCAITSSGTAYCWGYNAHGELGNGETSIVNSTPVAIVGGLTFQSLSVSKVEGVSCGIATSGAAYCWGDNAEGQLGDGTTIERHTPTPVAGGLTFKSIAVGNGHVCGIATTGVASCWGTTPNGAFGDGTIGMHLTPTPTAVGMTFQSIVAGNDYTCALTPAGVAYCWGLGLSGQLGNGSAAISRTPVAVSGGLTFRSLVGGGLSVCGLTTGGQAYCWGENFFGTLGEGTSATEGGATRRLSPTAVVGGLTFESLSAGYETMCGVTGPDAGYCWGYNFGAVGDGTFDHRSIPTAVLGGLAFQSVSSGTGYSCGVTVGAAVDCWGDNSNGELGDGTTVSRVTPTPVRWGSTVR
jgi:alpha-tubulin suppressor-like RCC1 family protein